MVGTFKFVHRCEGLGLIKVLGSVCCARPARDHQEGGPKVLPALRHIFVGWFNPAAREAIAQIVTARQLCGHPVSLNPA